MPDGSQNLTTWRTGDRLTADSLNSNFLTLYQMVIDALAQARTPDPANAVLESMLVSNTATVNELRGRLGEAVARIDEISSKLQVAGPEQASFVPQSPDTLGFKYFPSFLPGYRLIDGSDLIALVNMMLSLSGQGQIIETVPGSGNFVISPTSTYVAMRQAAPAAVTITLPPNPPSGRSVTVKDSLGVCSTHNFTINTIDGTLIDGVATFLFRANYQSFNFVFDGIGWGVNG